MPTLIKYGKTNTYLVRGTKGNLLVDTDYAGTLHAFHKAIKTAGIKVSEISCVLATHYHPDHIGLVSCLMNRGVRLVLMESQAGYVHYSDKIYAKNPALDFRPIDEKRAKTISFEQSRDFLAGLGIAGEIIPTQSHSMDSISVVLDDGCCIVGDLEPLDYLDAYPFDDPLQEDWAAILSRRPARICYGHANERILGGS